MTASQPNSENTTDIAGGLGDQLDLFATIDEFLRSPTIIDQLAAFLTARGATGPTGNGMFAACTVIDLFSFTIADLHHRLRTGPDQY
jgi:hypothetical protein